jgi:pimeloyl-ACP methyl ester carboxylesterase
LHCWPWDFRRPRARVEPFPPAFRTAEIKTDGAVIHVRIGGQGPAILMLHGFGDSGDMWQPLAVALMHDHTVVVSDLRGMGLSSHPDSGYDKKTEARDMAQLLDSLKIAGPVGLVTHDIGNMVGYAFAARYRDRVTRWVVMDAPLPGIGGWEAGLSNPDVMGAVIADSGHWLMEEQPANTMAAILPFLNAK